VNDRQRFALRSERWSAPIVGAVVAAPAVATTTALVYPLDEIAPVVALGVVYLVPVLLVSSFWGGWLGVATALTSALAFNFFHIPPTGRFTISEGENWVALAMFVIAALVASTLAERERTRTREAQERRQEADLAAEMARLLLRGSSLDDALPVVSARLAHALELTSATRCAAPSTPSRSTASSSRPPPTRARGSAPTTSSGCWRRCPPRCSSCAPIPRTTAS
jgi:two-component system sensor histidine kinase KdpD